jgi:hypothetical protein
VPGKFGADCFQAVSSVAEAAGESKPSVPANLA